MFLAVDEAGKTILYSHLLQALRRTLTALVEVQMVLYIHRDHKDYQGPGAQNGHLDFHTAPEL